MVAVAHNHVYSRLISFTNCPPAYKFQGPRYIEEDGSSKYLFGMLTGYASALEFVYVIKMTITDFS